MKPRYGRRAAPEKGSGNTSISEHGSLTPREKIASPERAGHAADTSQPTLSYESDGVYLTLPSDGPLTARDQQYIVMHIVRKSIQSIDHAAFHGALAGGRAAHVLIAPPQPEQVYDEDYTISVEDNHMTAYMTLFPAEEGKGARLVLEQVLNELASVHQFRCGVDGEAVRRMLKDGIYGQKTRIAQGLPPVPGRDGRLEFQFDTGNAEDDARKPEHVEKDALLVTKTPPTEGMPGVTVYGKPVHAPSGKNYNLPLGRNTYVSEDMLRLHAKVEGRAEYVNGSVNVSGCYEVEGDLDDAQASIDFEGDVVVRGNVHSDCQIKAAGNIEVDGMVEAAVLEAGGNITILGGVQGAGRASLRAGGSVYARFMEYATVRADDNVTVESLMHSDVSCYGAVEVLNGRGMIMGGSVSAGTHIAAKFIGNTGGLRTRVMVGASAAYRVEMVALEEDISSLRGVVSRLQRIVQLPPLQREPEKSKAARIEAMRKLLAQKKLLDESVASHERLKRRIEDMQQGQVHVVMTAYPGVILHIGDARREIREPVTYATFSISGSKIEFTSCRLKQQSTRINRDKTGKDDGP